MSAGLVVAVLVAGAIGALARWGTVHAFARMPSRLPWAVLVVNVLGSLVGGVVIGLAHEGMLGAEWRLILLTGFAGGLTTFSTFSVETIQLVHERRTRAAIVSVAANLVLGVGAAALGWMLVLLLPIAA